MDQEPVDRASIAPRCADGRRDSAFTSTIVAQSHRNSSTTACDSPADSTRANLGSPVGSERPRPDMSQYYMWNNDGRGQVSPGLTLPPILDPHVDERRPEQTHAQLPRMRVTNLLHSHNTMGPTALPIREHTANRIHDDLAVVDGNLDDIAKVMSFNEEKMLEYQQLFREHQDKLQAAKERYDRLQAQREALLAEQGRYKRRTLSVASLCD